MRNVLYAMVGVFVIMTTGTSAVCEDYGWYVSGNIKPDMRVKVELMNPTDTARDHSPITIRRCDMPFGDCYSDWLTVVDPDLSVPEGAENGGYIPSQADDIDKDGIWDELFFFTDFEAHESKTLYVYIGRNTQGEFNHKTHAEVGSYGKHVVPWWESEYMGWKLWFPNACDLYGRREVKLVSFNNITNSYGHNAPYDAGIDIMLVGNTFGAGGICLFEEPAHPDSVSRPRFSPSMDKGPFTNTRYAYDIVANGPLRSIVRSRTMNWSTGKGSYELDQLFTAYASKYYYTCKVTFSQFLPVNAETDFGCGIRKLPNESTQFQQDGIVISATDNLKHIITPIEGDPGLKRGVEEFLGLALVVKDNYNPSYRAIEGFSGNHTFRIPSTGNPGYEYLVASAWSEGVSITDYESFKEYVFDTAFEYNNPVRIQSLTPEKK